MARLEIGMLTRRDTGKILQTASKISKDGCAVIRVWIQDPSAPTTVREE